MTYQFPSHSSAKTALTSIPSQKLPPNPVGIFGVPAYWTSFLHLFAAFFLTSLFLRLSALLDLLFGGSSSPSFRGSSYLRRWGSKPLAIGSRPSTLPQLMHEKLLLPSDWTVSSPLRLLYRRLSPVSNAFLSPPPCRPLQTGSDPLF